MAGQMMNVTEAADWLGRSRWHIYDLIAAGKLRRSLGGKNGNRTYISLRALEDYVASTETPLPAKATGKAKAS